MDDNFISEYDISEIGKLLKNNQIKISDSYVIKLPENNSHIEKLESDLRVAKNDIILRIKEKNDCVIVNTELQKENEYIIYFKKIKK